MIAPLVSFNFLSFLVVQFSLPHITLLFSSNFNGKSSHQSFHGSSQEKSSPSLVPQSSETAPGSSQEKSSPSLIPQFSETAPSLSQEKSSPTPVPQSFKTPKAIIPIETLCEKGVGQSTGMDNADTFSSNLEAVKIMNHTSKIKDVKDDDDDNEPLSAKWEILKTVKIQVF
ncbi:hypothetical protein HAX54_043863 [Datura stramonium]|uniref:Uncharacterized protein n=1 Tax=Datura stramonium TaxID=4076 RepID=A0ABS8W3C6_DATST|nr:hypothetical protein [Datura stramonium]